MVENELSASLLDFMRYIRPQVATTTYIRKHWQIRSFFKYLEARKKNPVDVYKADVENYLSGLSCSQQFRQAICAVVREFYGFLRMRHPGACPEENPASGIKFKPDKSNRVFKVPSQASVDAIFARLYEYDDDLHIRDRLMAELAYGSGLRRAELSCLDIEDIDLETNTAQVMGKGGKPRVVPLTERTAVAVREYISRRHASRGPLFVSWSGRRIGPKCIYYTLRHRVGMRPHLFRHACATHLLKNGCSIRAIQELLGHERLNTTYIYTAVDKENLRDVIDRFHPRKLMKN